MNRKQTGARVDMFCIERSYGPESDIPTDKEARRKPGSFFRTTTGLLRHDRVK